MNVFIISGSRNRNGHTAKATAAITRGIEKAGGSAETVFLPELKLNVCRQCDNDGWGLCSREQRCVIEDDFQMVMDKIRKSDAVVFATPVYVSDLSELMRCFLDRCRRVSHPPAGGISPTQAIIEGKMPEPGSIDKAPSLETKRISAIGVCVAGGAGIGASACCARLDDALQKSFIFDVVDMIPVRRQNLEFKIPNLISIGQWLTTKPTSGGIGLPPM